MHGQLCGSQIASFALAGNATITVVNPRSGARFTYKIKAPRNRNDATVRYVSVLRGPNNETDYGYIGYIRADGFRYGGNRASVSPDAKSYKAFAWFWEHITDPRIEVYHEGKCGRCGRTLTVPESIESGFGPECISKV